MLDQLWYGDAERLAADSPVPVLRVVRTEDRPGGAANVCMDLVAMRGHVYGAGVVGPDEPGSALRAALRREGVNVDGLLTDPARPTTIKRSLIGLAQGRHPQKMFRVDIEATAPLSEPLTCTLLEAVQRVLPRVQVVCLEDYGKGVCTAEVCRGVMARARAVGVPVLVDPARGADFSKYRGATVLTPNRSEAEIATGLRTSRGWDPSANVHVARHLLTELDVDAVVLTLDREGAVLVERGGFEATVPTVAREVYDVTGAGDMMLAGLAAARAQGLPWLEAVHFANAAAGLEVEVFGVAPIPLERIHREVLRRTGHLRGKWRTLEQVLVEVQACRQSGGTIVFTNGCFDILHSGHVSLLERAAELGDMLIVGLNDDESVRRLKGPGRPVNPMEDRARVLGALACVSAVVPFSEDTPERLIEAIAPDVLVKGADYTLEQVVGAEIVRRRGGRVVLLDLVEGRSTSATIDRVRRG